VGRLCGRRGCGAPFDLGVIGTQHARFANFVKGPAPVLGYLGGLFTGSPNAHSATIRQARP